MKIVRVRWILFLALLTHENAFTQTIPHYSHQFSFSEDDDYINIRGQGTDKGYTSGLNLNLFYVKQEPSRFFIDKWMLKAGAEASNTFATGITHLIFTPKDLQRRDTSQGDYPYSGALYVHHLLHSVNAVKKYSLQTMVVAGVMGPLSFAEQIQTGVHKLIGDETPEGWANQLPNDILLNMEVAGEKQLLHAGNFFELIGGALANVGTMIDNIGVYSIARLGKMNPYFDGIIDRNGSAQSDSRWQLYLFAKPAARVIAYNALLQGGIVLNRSKIIAASIHHVQTAFDYGIMAVFRNVSISFTQKAFSPPVEGLKSQETGNVTLYFSWR